MSKELQELIDRSRAVQMSPRDREEQRQSFAYGNTHIENANITRESIAAAAKKLADGAR